MIKQIMVCDVTGEEIPEGQGMTLEWQYGTTTERRLDASGNYAIEDVPIDCTLHISLRVMKALLCAAIAGEIRLPYFLRNSSSAVLSNLKECLRTYVG